MKGYLVLIIAFFTLSNTSGHAQEQVVLKLTPEQVEALFIQQNLALIAERLNIDLADAAITQAKLWNNPSLSIDQVNLWSSSRQREGEDEVIPPLFGTFGKNTQFSVELSQLIMTAGKRGKLVNMEKVSKEIALQEFEELLRGVKLELRQSVNELIYLQAYQKVLHDQENSLGLLVEAYKRQTEKGNMSKNELLRLKASLLEIKNEANEIQSDLLQRQKELKILLNVQPTVLLVIDDQGNALKDPASFSLLGLIDLSIESRPDIKASLLKMKYYDKSLAYEKAQRVPNLNINATYDRSGGVWKNFYGFGVGFDLPFLNRNQGAIKIARINMEQSQHLAKQQENIALNEVAEAFGNYKLSYQFYKEMVDDDFSADLEQLFEAHTKNLLNKNISMLEFLDFSNAYRSNKQTILTAYKKLHLNFEELQYSVSTEIN